MTQRKRDENLEIIRNFLKTIKSAIDYKSWSINNPLGTGKIAEGFTQILSDLDLAQICWYSCKQAPLEYLRLQPLVDLEQYG